jgi:hypothetical protein
MIAGLALGAAGPGEWSLDRVIGIDPATYGSYVPFAITAGAGLGGALLLLGICWRPDPKPAET